MRIYSVGNQNTFRAVAINSKTVVKAQAIGQESINKINKTLANGVSQKAETLSAKFDAITAEMAIRRKIEGEKPWYKSTKYKKIDKMEAQQKAALVKEGQYLLTDAEKEVEESNKIKDTTIQELNENDTIEAINLKRIQKNDALNNLQAKLADNSKGFGRIAGYNKEKEILEKYFISEIKKEQAGEKANVPNSVLFFGPTGNGKTTFARAFAAETGCKLEKMRSNKDFLALLNKKLNEAENLFQTQGIRSILFIDELDKITGKNSAIVPELENTLSNCSEKYHATIFAATNYPLDIKLPLTGECSIFPYIVSMDPPNLQNKIDILEYYLKERSSNNIDYRKIAKLLESKEIQTGQKYNIAQIKDICINIPDSEFSEQSLIKTIEESSPTIDKAAFDKYMNEMDILMTNEVI